MKILLAPDSFKDCLSATEVARHMAEGIKRVDKYAEIRSIPVADGGEGFVQTMLAMEGGQQISCRVTDPLGREIDASYGMLDNGLTAVIEMATASGIELLSSEDRNPLTTTTRGTGQLMKDAMRRGSRKLIIGIGGSATNDGGTGMARALGYHFLDQTNQEITEGGGHLDQLRHIDQSSVLPILKQTEIVVACDVNNPLIGPNGASAVYGPQKGATPQMVSQLDKNLTHLALIIQKDLQLDLSQLPGGGAAGGLGAGLVAFAGAMLRPGFSIISEQTGLEQAIIEADLVFTGEGKIDHQTKQGKTPWGVVQLSRKYGKPCIGFAGLLGDRYHELYHEGFSSLFALPNGPLSLEESLTQAPELISDTAEQVFRLIRRYAPPNS
ncbi:glycerate kinase [Sunxiuqinia sp. sy24]|uniref:glycerate kinase n=1 Tax=Sunxiuqinia sp. sy24 TaxID=3461495 RepID=UPI004045F855